MFIFDSHCDSLSCAVTQQVSINQADSGRQFDFASALGTTDFQVMAVFVDRDRRQTIVYEDFLKLQRRLMEDMAANARVVFITEACQLAQWQKGPLGIVLALEGAEVIGTQLERLEEMYALGLRVMSFTWNNANALASGCGCPRDEGLSPLGREALYLLNRLGIVIDFAHLSAKGTAEVLRLAQAPLIDSHAACAALCPHPRNLSDAQIKALAQNGGVLGITFVAQFLRADEQNASLEDVVEHIVHVAELVGTEHIGIGSDFDGVVRPLPGLSQVKEVPDLAYHLVQIGFHAQEVEQIMGGNFKRLFENVLR